MDIGTKFTVLSSLVNKKSEPSSKYLTGKQLFWIAFGAVVLSILVVFVLDRLGL